MAQASFTADGMTPLAFSVNPRYPGRVSLNPGAVRGRTEGGEDYVYTKGVPHALIELRFEGLPAADFHGGYDYAAATQETGTQSLANWFMTFGQGGTFTYNDPFGTEHTISFEADRLDFSLTEFGLYDGVMVLRERIG